jgi:hypothetical protein
MSDFRMPMKSHLPPGGEKRKIAIIYSQERGPRGTRARKLAVSPSGIELRRGDQGQIPYGEGAPMRID